MGKRGYNIGGLSHLVREVFAQPEPCAQAAPNAPSPSVGSTDKNAAGNARTASQRDDIVEGSTSKKRKVGLLGPGYEKYDATGLVPYYTDAADVPDRLQKYFFQRARYFSLYDEGCLLDEEGWYSVTPERIAKQIAERCRCGTVLDAFCGVGGNAIAFAQTCERVIALDTSPTRLALARHNAVIYGVEDRIEFILADYISFARTYINLPATQGRKIDVVFLSPPWGGPEYLSGQPAAPEATNGETEKAAVHPDFSLAQIQPIHGAELFKLTRKITNNVAYFLPRNTNLTEVSKLLENENEHGTKEAERIEIEEEWMGPKLKALTCYFGGLVAGQEDLFDA